MSVCPGKIIASGAAADVKNIANDNPARDPVPNLDRIIFGEVGASLYRDIRGAKVEYRQSHPDAPRFDHDVTSPTYREDLKRYFNDFENIVGNIR